MTKKDYFLLAQFMADMRPAFKQDGYWHVHVQRLSDLLKRDNSRFNAVLFGKACGVDPRGPKPLEQRELS